jgi:hypothetical protein
VWSEAVTAAYERNIERTGEEVQKLTGGGGSSE